MLFKKSIRLSKIMSYGQDGFDAQSENGNSCAWWFCLSNYKVFYTDQLAAKYKFRNSEEILKSKRYVPMFQVDGRTYERRFLAQFGEVGEKRVQEILASDPDFDFDTAFRIFINDIAIEDDYHYSLLQFWGSYFFDRLRKDAIQWCEKYHINWRDR